MSAGEARSRAHETRLSTRRLIDVMRRAGRSMLAPEGSGNPIRDSRAAATLIGLDVSRPPIRLKTHSWVPLVAAGIVGAMFLAVLRVDVTRTRIGLAKSVAEELRLEGVKRELTVEMRKLRDPAALSRRARELGFGLAEQLIDLPRHGPVEVLPTQSQPLRQPEAAPDPLERPRSFEVVATDASIGGMRP